MFGFLNLDKPLGMTSHDCVARVRRCLKLRQVGHGGTLDPAARGVLPIALGRATRLLRFLASAKTYQATIRFGIVTTTDDLEGAVIQQRSARHLEQEIVQGVLPLFLGTIQQIPPQYSAIQIQGQRAYDRARAGEVVELVARSVDIYRLTIVNWRSGDFPELDLEVACGPGTYIRSLARDLGVTLQVGATLAALTRTESCGLLLPDSIPLDRLTPQTARLYPPEAVLQHWPRLDLNATLAQRWCHGQRLPLAEIATMPSPDQLSPFWRIYQEPDIFLGMAALQGSGPAAILQPEVVLPAQSPLIV